MNQSWHLPNHNAPKDHKVAYMNARLIDPESGLDAKGALLTIGSEIVDFGERLFNDGTPEGTEIVDCGSNVLCPGLLDLQANFCEPGYEHKETIATGSKSAAAGGITTVVCQPATRPVMDDISVLEFLKNRARETSYVNIRAYASISKGMKGQELTEMGLLKETGVVVGFTDDKRTVMNAQLMRHAMEYASMFDLPIAQHAEDINLSDGGCMHEGAVSARLGLKGIPNASEAIIVERDLLLLELAGGHYHILHISTHQAIEAVRRAKARGLLVTAEASPHHFTLTDEAVLDYRTFAKVNPPLRSEVDRQAVIQGLKDGTIDAISTGHSPHDQESKRVPLANASFGIVGVETMLPLSLKLVQDKHLSLHECLGKMTYQAADIIREPAGRLKRGLRADLTIIDLNHKWRILPDSFAGKSKNSPFEDLEVIGRAIRTVTAGQHVYSLK